MSIAELDNRLRTLIKRDKRRAKKVIKLNRVMRKAEALCEAIVRTDYGISCFTAVIPKEMVKDLRQAIAEAKKR